ncbi:hypothetical protein IC607_01215 [Cellulomonas sp. JH27-2]|uniref:hypothetical protein n=1 Tax=Cellulomonas sp. JH27-2 TaxID=2774139 RepID=UPI001781169D|nr:hypothetical protein [Cellulomonas sp. JH27-2]MBD8057589.1 hypothetical protein [Cellulomonas sp. JH27-2]
MTVSDHDVDPALAARVRQEFAHATWFTLAAATARAHHAVDALPSPYSPRCDAAERRAAEDRQVVLEELLAEETARSRHGTA